MRRQQELESHWPASALLCSAERASMLVKRNLEKPAELSSNAWCCALSPTLACRKFWGAQNILGGWAQCFAIRQLLLQASGVSLPSAGLCLNELLINPHQQHMDAFFWVMDWEGMVSTSSLVGLLEKHFFPKWLQVRGSLLPLGAPEAAGWWAGLAPLACGACRTLFSALRGVGAGRHRQGLWWFPFRLSCSAAAFQFPSAPLPPLPGSVLLAKQQP